MHRICAYRGRARPGPRPPSVSHRHSDPPSGAMLYLPPPPRSVFTNLPLRFLYNLQVFQSSDDFYFFFYHLPTFY